MKIEDLDKILEQSLTNINIKSSSEVPDKEIDNLANSALSFLDNEEKNEKTKIQDYQKIKSVINDPLEKKTKENSIKQSQNKISTINQIKNTLNNDKLKLQKSK
jgi:organic radical activating enzyme